MPVPPLSPPESVTDFMSRLCRGDDAAATAVFRRYVARLIGFTRCQLETWVRRKVDPEDVVQSVFKSFFARYGDGQFSGTDWDSLWGVLALIALRKCASQVEYWQAARRDVRREEPGVAEVLDRAPTPAEAAALTETVENLMRGLDPREREVLALYLQGCENETISQEVGRSERYVWRTLELVRKRLEAAV